MTDLSELRAARLAATAATAAIVIVIAGILGIYPPGWVAQVVAFAFGLAAASLFPAIFMGIFVKRIGSIGMVINFAVACAVCSVTAKPPAEVDALVERIRIPGN